MVEFILPIDPIPKLRARADKRGFHYTPAKTKKFERDVKLLIASQWKSEPLSEPLEIDVVFQIKRPASVSAKQRPCPSVKPDIDNLGKSLIDACNGILWKDDALIVKVTKEKIYGDTGQIVLRVKPYQQQAG